MDLKGKKVIQAKTAHLAQRDQQDQRVNVESRVKTEKTANQVHKVLKEILEN